MHPIQTIIQRISLQLQVQGYLIEINPGMAGIRGLLYACSPKPYTLLAARVIDHFLFMDWENQLFGRKDHLIDAYKAFNRNINKKFKVPHVMRMTIPNMAIIALSESGFDEDTILFARNTYLVPWKGGEVGQFFLLDIDKKEISYHQAYQRKQYGAAPLIQAQGILIPMMQRFVKDDFVLPGKHSLNI